MFLWFLPLQRRVFGVLSLDARLALAEALRPGLKLLVTVEGSTRSGTLLKESWDSSPPCSLPRLSHDLFRVEFSKLEFLESSRELRKKSDRERIKVWLEEISVSK